VLSQIHVDVSRIKYLLPEKNLGWIGGINAGIDQALKDKETSHILFLNDDTEFVPHKTTWLRTMLESFDIDSSIGAVGPCSNNVMGFQNMHIMFTAPTIGTTGLSGFCMLLKREVVEKIGKLDIGLMNIGGDDLDYSIRITEAGYRLGVRRDVFVYHVGEMSYREKWGDYYNSSTMMNDHYGYLIRKHGFKSFLKCINFKEGEQS
jgi:O-antigen biosynthesis protein